jgi:hypothetical protein
MGVRTFECLAFSQRPWMSYDEVIMHLSGCITDNTSIGISCRHQFILPRCALTIPSFGRTPLVARLRLLLAWLLYTRSSILYFLMLIGGTEIQEQIENLKSDHQRLYLAGLTCHELLWGSYFLCLVQRYRRNSRVLQVRTLIADMQEINPTISYETSISF